MFDERGYVPATIDAIAERAGVSRRTVFTSVGGKADLLKLGFDRTLAGDDEPIPIGDSPVVQQLMEATNPSEVLGRWMAMNAAINTRIAPLHRVVVVAADADPDVAALLATTDHQRLDGARTVLGRVAELGGLRDELTLDVAAAIVDVLIDPANFTRFVRIRHWSVDVYTRHLERIAAASILC